MLKHHVTQINAHGRSEISAMVQSSSNPEEFVTIAHDGLIKIWSIEKMTAVSSARIKCGYLTALINFQSGYIVGTGQGMLIKFNSKLEREWSKKVHSDCVNDMIETECHLISISSDGKVCFMEKESLTVEKQLDLLVPLMKISRVGEDIYVSGNPSFKINLSNFEVSEERRSLQFIEFKGRIAACSEQKGLEVLSFEQNFDQMDCHFMLCFKNRLITISEQVLGILDFERSDEGDEEISYSIRLVPQLKAGYSIKTGFVHNDCILVAGEDGHVYKFRMDFLQL